MVTLETCFDDDDDCAFFDSAPDASFSIFSSASSLVVLVATTCCTSCLAIALPKPRDAPVTTSNIDNGVVDDDVSDVEAISAIHSIEKCH